MVTILAPPEASIDDIVVTKELCIEGSRISVIRDGEIGRECGVSSMHDITKGGVLGALFEIT